MSLLGRPRRFFHPRERHFAVVDAILYPPKVSSERVENDVGTDGKPHSILESPLRGNGNIRGMG
jgi:hypothetical protein